MQQDKSQGGPTVRDPSLCTGGDANQEANTAIANQGELGRNSFQYHGNAAAWKGPEPKLPKEMPAEKILEGGGKGRDGWLGVGGEKLSCQRADSPTEGHRIFAMATEGQGRELQGIGKERG